MCACYHPSKINVYSPLNASDLPKKVKFQPHFNFKDKNDHSELYTVRKFKDMPDTWYMCNQEVLVPCGHCVGCSSDISRDWSYRMLMEKAVSKNAWFLTLTYDDEHIPSDHQLDKSHLDDFIKKLRNYYYDLGLDNIRYYACGEYGSKTVRPHYHMIVYNIPLTPMEFNLFGVSPPSEVYKNKVVGTSLDKTPLYQIDFINNLWNNGYVVIGEVTQASCAYVARYVNKKRLSGVKNEELKENGITPEFNCMSRMPGIGVGYYEKYRQEILGKKLDFYIGSSRISVGRSFEKWLEKYHPEEMNRYKELKIKKALYGMMYNQQLELELGDINAGLERDEQLKISAMKSLKRNVE